MSTALEVYDNWLASLRTEETRSHYANHLSIFCRFHTSTPEKLLEDSLEGAKGKVLKYILHLKSVARPTAGKGPKGSISVNSIPTYLTGVQSFYTFHERALNWKKYRGMMPEKTKSDLRSYEVSEVQALLMYAKDRDPVIILLMLAAGPRVGALPDLKFKHVLPIENSGGIGMLKLYADSDRSHYVSLLTPEAMAAIDSYSKYRKDHGEKITPESWLLREKFSELGDKRNDPRKMTKQGIYVTVRRLMDKAKIKDPRLQPDHSFRYFFDTAVMNSDVRHEFKELFMGHSVGLDEYYYDANTKESQKKILFEYSKAVDALTIHEENRQKRKIVELEKKAESTAQIQKEVDKLYARLGIKKD